MPTPRQQRIKDRELRVAEIQARKLAKDNGKLVELYHKCGITGIHYRPRPIDDIFF